MLSRRKFLRNLFGTAAFTAGATGVYANGIERHELELRTVPISLGLPRPFRIAALGDIHFDPLCETEYLSDVLKLVQSLRPDIVCYTGDYCSRDSARIAEFAALTRIARPEFGSFAVLGNHDHWAGRQRITDALESEGVRMLKNENVPLGDLPGWKLAGIDSYWSGKPDAHRALDAEPTDQFVVLVHEPDSFDVIRDPRARLQVSGHTHGGQVRAPLVGALRLPSWGRLYDEGHFRRGDRHLYVNRGIGTVDLPIRFNCRPEVTLFTLT